MNTIREGILTAVNRGDDHTLRQVCLMLLLGDGQRTVRDLAAEMNVPKPVITRAVDRLVTDNYVTRVN